MEENGNTLASFLDTAGRTVGNVVGAFRKPTVPAQIQAREQFNLQQALPFIIGGGVLLVILAVILGRK